MHGFIGPRKLYKYINFYIYAYINTNVNEYHMLTIAHNVNKFLMGFTFTWSVSPKPITHTTLVASWKRIPKILKLDCFGNEKRIHEALDFFIVDFERQ